MSDGTGERVTMTISIPASVRSPPTRARPPTPQRMTKRSPTRRAHIIAIANATTPVAATAALVCAGPERNTAAQFIVDVSTKMHRNVRNAGSASAPRGSANRAVSTAESSEPGSSLGTAKTAIATAHPATSGNTSRGPYPATAAIAAIADPLSSPKLQAPCSAESTGRPSRCSIATPCAFALTSRIPSPAPSTQASGMSTASDGANAASARPVAPTTKPSPTGPRLPRCETSQPATGSEIVAVSVTARITRPSSPLSRPSRCFSAGSRATQTPSNAPRPMKATASAMCAARTRPTGICRDSSLRPAELEPTAATWS